MENLANHIKMCVSCLYLWTIQLLEKGIVFSWHLPATEKTRVWFAEFVQECSRAQKKVCEFALKRENNSVARMADIYDQVSKNIKRV